MWQRLVSLLPRGRFVRRLAWLTGGMFFGQLLLVAATPLLTRLYTPEDFGLFAVIGALNGIFGIVMAGRYEFAIPLSAKDDEAAALVVIAGLIALFLSLVSLLLVWILGEALADLTGLPALINLLWFLPPILLVTGLGQPLEYWSIRRGALRLTGASRLVHYGGQAASQTVFGVAGTGALGLTLGYGLGYLGRFGLLLATLSKADWAGLAAARPSQIRRLAWSLRRYPTYATTSSLVQSTTQFLPTILLTVLYGPAVAGGFDLAQRILAAPVRLLSSAASQVFHAEAAERSAGEMLRLFVRTVPRFLFLGLAGMAPLLFAGPALFAFVFGEPWREAGSFAQALVAAQLGRFVAVPVSQAFNIFGRLDIEFGTSLLSGFAMVCSFVVIGWLEPSPARAVLIYSLASALSQLIMLGLAWRTTRRAASNALPAGPNSERENG
jgi:O-antigen/teichoic acid export membrane protein